MGKTLYVGNLPYGTSDNDLETLCEPHGKVQSAQVVMDRVTGSSKRFGFVEMRSVEEAQAAIVALNGKGVHERTIIVNDAQSRDERNGSRMDRDRCGDHRS
jgi:cold-inducible RNA-binding protein